VFTDCRFIVFVRHQILSTSKLSALRGPYHGIAFSADNCSTGQLEGGVIFIPGAEVVLIVT